MFKEATHRKEELESFFEVLRKELLSLDLYALS